MKILHSKGDGDGRGLRGVSLLMLSSCSSKQLAQAVNDGQWLKVGEGNAHQSHPVTKQIQTDTHDYLLHLHSQTVAPHLMHSFLSVMRVLAQKDDRTTVAGKHGSAQQLEKLKMPHCGTCPMLTCMKVH